jgi:phage-related protein
MICSKIVRFHSGAREVIREWPDDIREKVGKAVSDLQSGRILSMPLSRPMPIVALGVWELRIRGPAGQYRLFYWPKHATKVLVFHAFMKKTQHTPDHETKLGRKRLREMRNAEG